jgi:ATP/ADP translocase
VGVLLKDKYLLNVAMMVVSYGLTMEFTEIIWKSTVKKGKQHLTKPQYPLQLHSYYLILTYPMT